MADVQLTQIHQAKASIQHAADEILQQGLSSGQSGQHDLFEGLAVFYHLGELPLRVQGVVDHSLASLLESMQASLDTSMLKGMYTLIISIFDSLHLKEPLRKTLKA